LLPFGRALQLEQQVPDWQGVGDNATVVIDRDFGASVARETDQLSFVNVLRDERTGTTGGFAGGLALGRYRKDDRCGQRKRGEPQSTECAKHESPCLIRKE
jgi:hypothetical protein